MLYRRHEAPNGRKDMASTSGAKGGGDFLLSFHYAQRPLCRVVVKRNCQVVKEGQNLRQKGLHPSQQVLHPIALDSPALARGWRIWMVGSDESLTHDDLCEAVAYVGLEPRGYVEDEGRSLGDALQGESPNRPKRLEHNGVGRERWGKRHLRDVRWGSRR